MGRATIGQTVTDCQTRGKVDVMDMGIEGLVWVSTVGSGGFGTVHRAHDEAHGRDVAVKILHGSSDEDSRRRFDRERRLMGSLSGHPHIVSIHTSGYTASGSPYLVMELVPGGSLADRLSRGRLSASETIQMGRRLTNALVAAHDAGVLHLDIKPENVLLGASGEPMLTDFGIASTVSEVSLRNTISVSPAFSAPEALNEFAVDERTDIYSLAATLYTTATGLRPYQVGGEGVLATLARMITDPVPTISDPAVPHGFSALLARGMAKDPGDRQQTMRAFADELAAIGSAPPPAIAYTSPPAQIAPNPDTQTPRPGGAAPAAGQTVSGATAPAQPQSVSPQFSAPADQKQGKNTAIKFAVGAAVIAIAVGVAILLALRATGGESATPGPSIPQTVVDDDQRTPEPAPSATPPPAPSATEVPTAEPTPPDDGITDTTEVTTPTAARPIWSLGRTEELTPVQVVLSVPVGTPQICLFWDYDGVEEGSSFDARWLVNGQVDDFNTVLGGTTPGSPGTFYACYDDANGIPAGLYEVEWTVDGELVFGEHVFVGDGLEPVRVTVINDSPVDLCEVMFSPDDAGTFGLDDLRRVLPAGESREITLPAETYDLRVRDCDGRVRFEDVAGRLVFDGIIIRIP